MNVLSLFDGMSCAQIALERVGFHVENYFASEVDKWAIKVTQANYPNTIQLGDVTKIKASDLPVIDLLIGGSPCQGFSFAGKGLNFEDERSKLFFEYVRILNEVRPKYFLLENVKMKKEWVDIISEKLGVRPILINSALVSAQNRNRLYWTNISSVTQPQDKNIFLKDIIQDGVVDREKSYCLDASYYKGGDLNQYKNKSRRQLVFRVNDNKRVGYITENENGYRPHCGDQRATGISELGRILKPGSKTNTLTSAHSPKVALNDDIDNLIYRKLTPIECERLQTVPDNYTNHVSNTQCYKMLGNGFTVDVIAHILSHIK